VNYHVVFDVSQNSSQLVIFALIILFALLPGLIGWGLIGSSNATEAFKGKFFLLISFIGVALSLVALISVSWEYYDVRKALRTGNFQVAEGTIENFVPMPSGGHSTESFKVGTTSFAYGSGWGSIVFNSEWNHGFIRNGVQVRISYRDGDILRVETR